MNAPHDLFDWQRHIRRSDLRSTVKLVLIFLSTYMTRNRLSAWPIIDALAEDTSSDEKTVRLALKEAEAAGWIVSRAKRTGGKAWANKIYRATLPNRLMETENVPEGAGAGPGALPAFDFLPDGAGPTFEGAGAASSCCGSSASLLRVQDPTKYPMKIPLRDQEDARASPAPDGLHPTENRIEKRQFDERRQREWAEMLAQTKAHIASRA